MLTLFYKTTFTFYYTFLIPYFTFIGEKKCGLRPNMEDSTLFFIFPTMTSFLTYCKCHLNWHKISFSTKKEGKVWESNILYFPLRFKIDLGITSHNSALCSAPSNQSILFCMNSSKSPPERRCCET